MPNACSDPQIHESTYDGGLRPRHRHSAARRQFGSRQLGILHVCQLGRGRYLAW